MNYNKEYFIAKYESIPESQWTRRWLKSPEGKSCALGHCGVVGPWDIEHVPEAIALINIFADNGLDVTIVNDSAENPKDAILSALRSFT